MRPFPLFAAVVLAAVVTLAPPVSADLASILQALTGGGDGGAPPPAGPPAGGPPAGGPPAGPPPGPPPAGPPAGPPPGPPPAGPPAGPPPGGNPAQAPPPAGPKGNPQPPAQPGAWDSGCPGVQDGSEVVLRVVSDKSVLTRCERPIPSIQSLAWSACANPAKQPIGEDQTWRIKLVRMENGIGVVELTSQVAAAPNDPKWLSMCAGTKVPGSPDAALSKVKGNGEIQNKDTEWVKARWQWVRTKAGNAPLEACRVALRSTNNQKLIGKCSAQVCKPDAVKYAPGVQAVMSLSLADADDDTTFIVEPKQGAAAAAEATY